GRERKGRPVGRYLMCVHSLPQAIQIAVLEGRSLIEHYVSRPADDATQIHGNIYLGRVQNVLPGMEAAFVDIGTPKNAVLYRGDVQYDAEDVEERGRDVERLQRQWQQLDALASRSRAPALLYREPPLAVRVIREEFNRDYRGVVIDDPALYQEVRDYVEALIPELAERVELYDEPDLPLFERMHIHEQLHKALDRKVWLPSGGSVIIERTEALTVIDVNTGKNVGSSSLEDTVFVNNR